MNSNEINQDSATNPQLSAAELRQLLSEDQLEWNESIDYIRKQYGETAVMELFRGMQDHLLASGMQLNEATLNTPYINSISIAEQPGYPGDIEMEKRIENMVRWNAMAMVLKAQDAGSGVGGHIATYASCATTTEVGFNHFFRARTDQYNGDLFLIQPHAAPGVYARAFLEGRLSEEKLLNFRRELSAGGGLSSYPHPRSMPDFWQLPNASMGLSTPSAIYHARFAKYLENRGLKQTNGEKVWCFIGDGESDEPEVIGTINIAARENLDNLILVVNCNLQRLDGPVRGNGKIIQELERSFRGADWNVLKVIWGGGWDALLAQDRNGTLRRRMEECVDGDYQHYSVMEGDYQREHWVAGNPELEQMMNSLTDDEIRDIKRGGQDPKKVYAAFDRASKSVGKPTVILIKTVKGDGMGSAAQGKNTAHQKKNLNAEERIACAKDYGIPISEEAMARADFYRPDENSPEMQYLKAQREKLGGYLPQRRVECPVINPPERSIVAEFQKGTGEREASTTAVLVRFLSRLLKDKEIGRFVVPIVPDEARTFGIDGLFKQAGIYSAAGQNYTPVDADTLLPYREAKDGQILQEGICEAGAMASFMAAGSAYATQGVPTIPFYLFYSMFGFQRVGDMIWACADMMCKGFLFGATAGRTTLNGEGLQHQDGHSHVLAATVPCVKSYDPAFGYELAVIIRDGIRRMYQEMENIFYYITVYNENYPMPAMTEQEGVEQGILKGLYRISAQGEGESIHLMASGAIMTQAQAAERWLLDQGFNVSLWSVTSFSQLYRDASEVERQNRLNAPEVPARSHIESLLGDQHGSFVAVSDWMQSHAAMISPWIPGDFTALGTEGFGACEDRQTLRDHFEISADYICQAALSSLLRTGKIDRQKYQALAGLLAIDSQKIAASSR